MTRLCHEGTSSLHGREKHNIQSCFFYESFLDVRKLSLNSMIKKADNELNICSQIFFWYDDVELDPGSILTFHGTH